MRLEKIEKIAAKVDIPESALEKYGNYKAKISKKFIDSVKNRPVGKLVLVTAITPTKAGEGKTTTSIALLDGLAKIHQKAILSLREPSLGPVFGLKGGATGGGKVTVEPHEDINLHFTGDMHALTSSINLIAAIIDNHIYQGNELNIDPTKIVWKRALDMNERELREIEIGLGSEKNGIKRTDHFEITVASELMAILCISTSEEDFYERIKKIIVAYTYDDNPVYLSDLKISNAVMKLMHYALLPNIVQTAEGNPALIHGGPFANIAHGCSSLISIKLGLKVAPITITEAGFGADLGAEKFLDITAKVGNLTPNLIVLVATIRALKLHGGIKFEDLTVENIGALKEGFKNLEQHYYNLRKYDVPVVVAINHFKDDTKLEIDTLKEMLNKHHPDTILLAESIHPNFATYTRSLGFNALSDAELYELGFDLLYPYNNFEYLKDYLIKKDSSYLDIYKVLLEYEEAYNPSSNLRIRGLENHDQPRLIEYTKKTEDGYVAVSIEDGEVSESNTTKG